MTVVTLTNIFNFSEDEQKSSDILNRMDIRKELNQTCQQIIYYSFKIKELRQRKENLTEEDDNNFCHMRKILQINKTRAFTLREQIKAFTVATDIDKIDEIAENLNNNIGKISENLSPLNSIKRKIKFQTSKMRLLQKNVEECLSLVKNK